MGKALNITLNGQARKVEDGATIGDLVDTITPDRARIAVERNKEIVKRDTFDETPVHDGDEIEVVSLVGGG